MSLRALLSLLAWLLACPSGGCGRTPAGPAAPDPDVVATFSICALDPATGDLGVAVQSRFFGVGAVVPWVRADVGAVATQALANPAYGPDGLDLLDDGVSAERVVDLLTGADRRAARRQLGVVDARGGAAAWTGEETSAWAGHRVGRHCCCQGNILAGQGVVDAMATAFEKTGGPLAERLVAALVAGQAAGGDKRGRQSAALVVARRFGGFLGGNDRYIDLRVDDHPRPIEELGRLLTMRRSLGRDAPVPGRMDGLVREPRLASPGRPSARAVWERWRRRRREGDWAGVLALAGAAFRKEHDAEGLRAIDAEDPLGPKAEAGVYLGTEIGPREGGGPPVARLYFAVRGEAEPAMILMVQEDGRWTIVP